MSTPIRNITLSFPCREDWEKFEEVPAHLAGGKGGRLCANCHHIVRDFRDCSMEELEENMKAGYSCGVFRRSQLSAAFVRAAAAALAVTTVTACDINHIEPAAQENTPALTTPEPPPPPSPFDDEYIVGIIVAPDSVVVEPREDDIEKNVE